MKRWITGTAILVLMIVGVQTSFAQTNLRLRGVGAQMGLVDPEHINSAFGFGGILELGTLLPGIHLEANIDYWKKTDRTGSIRTRFRDTAAGGTLKFFFKTANPDLRPFVASGVALHFVKSSIPVEGPGGIFGNPNLESSDTKLGLDLGGGLNYRLNSQFDLFGDLRYRVVSDLNQFELKFGALFHLPI